MATGTKLVRVKPDEINPTHPLYALFLKTEDLDHEDMDRVYQFFEDMLLPNGYYASVQRDKYGWWITFYKPVFV